MSLRLKRHIGLPMLLALVACVLILGLGDQRICAYSVHGSSAVAQQGVSLGSDVALHVALAVSSFQIPH